MKMRVSVVVPTCNRWNTLQVCLDSLLSQSMPPYQIIVVDGNSTDATQERIKSYPVDFFIQNKKGLVYAYNYGVHRAKGDIVAFIDDDAKAKRDWIEQLQGTYMESKKVGGVGGRIIQTGKAPVFSLETLDETSSALLKPLLSIYNTVLLEDKISDVGVVTRNGAVIGNFSKEFEKPIRVDHLRGANMSFRREVLESIGLFDMRFDFCHATLFETDACVRVSQKGFGIWYNPNAIVWHLVESQGSSISSLVYNDLLFYIKDIRNARSDSNDWSFLLRFLSQLAYAVSMSARSKEGALRSLMSLVKIPSMVGRAFIVSDS